MNFGTIILKPDFFEDISYLNYFEELLKKNNCKIINCYAVKNYTEINNTYRKNDLKKRYGNKKDFEKNFSRSMIAYDSYNLLNSENVGLLLNITQNKKNRPTELYCKLQGIKQSLRDFIEASRNFVYLYITNDSNIPELIKAKHEEFNIIKKHYGDNVKLAFINGIHLEDFKMFKKKNCYKTFKKLGIINKYNKINPQDISLLFKKFESNVDLHIHSSRSDGKYNLDEVANICESLNVKYASVTDHDIISILNISDKFISGVEFNSIVNNKKCHILCYAMDIKNKNFQKLLMIQKLNRIKQLKYRVKQLKERYDICLKENDIQDLINNNHFSRNYLAELLVRYKYSSSNEMALNDYVNKLKNGNYLISIKTLLKLIHKAKGKLVLAHPLGNYKHRKSENDFEKENKLILRHVDGIECFYSDYSNHEIGYLFDVAQRYKLIPTCGSDFHGNRLSNERIGKISKESLDFKNTCNFMVAKKQILETMFRRKYD